MKASERPRLSLFKSLFPGDRKSKADPQASAYSASPDGALFYAIGDIHGRADLLAKLLSEIDEDKRASSGTFKHCTEIYLGDYIDRGPDSAKVIEMLIERGRQGPCMFIRGNHETMLLDLLDEELSVSQVMKWLKFGGTSAALSYQLTNIPREHDELAMMFGHRLRESVPESHKAFLRSTVEYFDAFDYVFTHAGIRPGVPLADQTYEDLSTIREEFLDSQDDFGFVVVHGHTPVMAPEFRPNRINIDTGAYATGLLTCLKIDGAGPTILSSSLSAHQAL